MDKQDFISARECSRAGWYSFNKRGTPSDEALFHMKQGTDVGKLARTFFPVHKPLGSCLGAAFSKGVYFEKEFSWNDFNAPADILLKLSNDKITLIKESVLTAGARTNQEQSSSLL